MDGISDISCHRVVVVAQGHVGLPVAIRAVEVGFDAVGFSIDKARVDCLRKACTCIDDITESDLSGALAVVCVPTPLRDSAPDLGHVEGTAGSIAPRLRPGCCAVLESTTHPGATEETFAPILEAGSGLRGCAILRWSQPRAHRSRKQGLAIPQHSKDHHGMGQSSPQAPRGFHHVNAVAFENRRAWLAVQ